MQKCCLVGCDNDSSKGVSDYCEPHRREKERQLMDDTGFRAWYNDQPYKGERLAFNAWQASERQAVQTAITLLMPNPPYYMDTFGARYARKLAKHFGIEI